MTKIKIKSMINGLMIINRLKHDYSQYLFIFFFLTKVHISSFI